MFIACSECFIDEGLKIDAHRLGTQDPKLCPNCNNSQGNKLTQNNLEYLAYRFFYWGSLHKCEYGAAPIIAYNLNQPTSIKASSWLQNDILLFEQLLGIGLFYYGPNLWMVGEIEPLKDLQDPMTRESTIEKIISSYPTKIINHTHKLYRIRTSPEHPDVVTEYDSPPKQFLGGGRLDAVDHPILYASENLDICLHECRVTAEDDIYLATLQPIQELKLLDLSVLINEENITTFESLDEAMHMLFLASSHAYPITRAISKTAYNHGFDGIVFPSYFSLLKSGTMPFQTTYGISNRRIPEYQALEQNLITPNIALFGYPIRDNKIKVKCINKLTLSMVAYDVRFGPLILD